MSDSPTTDHTDTRTKTRPSTRKKPQFKRPPMYHIVLHDDNDHSYGYVMAMLVQLFGKSLQSSLKMASEVDQSGRVICETTHKERAEFKRDQIHAFGADAAIAGCAGAMTATIEPAWGEGDDRGDDNPFRGGGNFRNN